MQPMKTMFSIPMRSFRVFCGVFGSCSRRMLFVQFEHAREHVGHSVAVGT